MLSTGDFHFKPHQLLLELDESTTDMKMLVVSGEMTGERWTRATRRQSAAYTAWNTFINESSPPKLVSHLP